jgi:hypothetical protein
LPSGNETEVLDRALTLLIDNLERRRFAQASRPREPTSGPTSGLSRYIPAHVRRAVWKRDGGQCAFVGSEGRCGETAFLEFHHVEAFALGGAATVENISVRCRAHNGYEARVLFGTGMVREHRSLWPVACR